MTVSTQVSVMAAIEAALPDGIVLVVDGEYANTGTVYARRADELDPVGKRLRYNFQADRVEFAAPDTNPHDAQTKAAWSTGTGSVDWWVGRLDALVDRVVTLLTGGTVEVAP